MVDARLAVAASRDRSVASADHAADVEHHRLVQRFVALQPGEVDELADQRRQPVRLVLHAAANRSTALGSSARARIASASSDERADRRLQLVARHSR